MLTMRPTSSASSPASGEGAPNDVGRQLGMGRAPDRVDLGGPRPRASPRLASGWARPGLGTGPLADGEARRGYEPRAAADDGAPRPGGRGLGGHVSPRRRAP